MNKKIKIYISFIILSFYSCALNGCVYSAATTGAQAFYHRRDLKSDIRDNYLALQINNLLRNDPVRFGEGNIATSVDGHIILLAGQVRTPKQKSAIEEAVRQLADNREIYNYIEVANPSSAITRASDAWITAKIKSRLIAIDEVDASRIKVVTENGTTYLMGVIPPEEATIAVAVARDTAGVQNIVKIFSYIHISKV